MSAQVAFIGGTNMGKLFGEGYQQKRIKTPYGKVMYQVIIKDGIEFIAINRHYASGVFCLPHQINHQAYMYALYSLGIQYVIATSAVGGISGNTFDEMKTGSFVLPLDFMDFTREAWTFATSDFTDPVAFHRSTENMICPSLQNMLLSHAVDEDVLYGGILGCTVKGPRYETHSEVVQAKKQGVDLLGMTTAVPEIILAREISIHYALIANVTNMPLDEEAVQGEFVQNAAAKTHQRLLDVVWKTIVSLNNPACRLDP